MSITDKLAGIAIDLVTSAIADKAVDLAEWIVAEMFGDAADDDAKTAIARGALQGAAAAAAALAQERQAAGRLDARAAEVLGAIAAIDVAALFTPKAHGHAGPQEIEILPPNTEGLYRTLGEEMAEMGLTSSSDKPDAG